MQPVALSISIFYIAQDFFAWIPARLATVIPAHFWCESILPTYAKK
jgi:hypothetical protein